MLIICDLIVENAHVHVSPNPNQEPSAPAMMSARPAARLPACRAMVLGARAANLAPETAENWEKSTNQAQRGGGAMASALFSKNNPVKKHIN